MTIFLFESSFYNSFYKIWLLSWSVVANDILRIETFASYGYHMMNDDFSEILDDFVVIYIDRILIYSKSIEDHEKHVHMVSKKLCDMELYTKLDKCEFHQSQVEFFEYIISNKDVSMDSKKVQIIID